MIKELRKKRLRKKKLKKRLNLILCIIILLLFSKNIINIKNKNTENNISESNFLLETRDINTTNFDEIIEMCALEYKDNLSLYYYNFNTNEEYSYNGDTYYVAASTTKIPLSMSAADDAFNGLYSIDSEIEYLESDYEEGTGVLYYQDYINSVTVDEAINLSIVYSDNITKNMLRRIVSTSTYDYINNITGDVLSNSNENKYTAKQLGEVLKKLYINENNNPYYDNILEYMKESIFHDRLDKYIPYEDVAHKIGNYYRYYHDMGIVYGKEDYVLVIMTKDIGELDTDYYEDEDERILLDGGDLASEIMANISLEIYNLVNKV